MTQTLTERAILARINRKLRQDSERVCKCRSGSQGHDDLGDYYLVDTYTNTVRATHLDLEKLGRELGVLRESEGVCHAS